MFYYVLRSVVRTAVTENCCVAVFAVVIVPAGYSTPSVGFYLITWRHISASNSLQLFCLDFKLSVTTRGRFIAWMLSIVLFATSAVFDIRTIRPSAH
jgi:hypothetical protein